MKSIAIMDGTVSCTSDLTTLGALASSKVLASNCQSLFPGDLTWGYTAGWRLSVAMAGAPGIIILFAGIVLPDSPNSLAERGHFEEARRVRAAHYV